MPLRRSLLRFSAAIGLALACAVPGSAADIDLASLARCLREKGAVFYGAHWCPVCAEQKQYFDGYSYLLPYVECYDGPKEDGSNDRCTTEGIESYPTWKFSDGTVQTGARKPEELAEATGCTIGYVKGQPTPTSQPSQPGRYPRRGGMGGAPQYEYPGQKY